MLRSVTLGLVLSVLAACALVEPPAPADTFMIQGEARNLRPRPVHITVRTADGDLPGAVRPPSLAPGPSSSNVTIHLPIGEKWWVIVDGDPFLVSTDVDPDFKTGGCMFVLKLNADGTSEFNCINRP